MDQVIEIEADVKLVCADTLSNRKNWRLYEVNIVSEGCHHFQASVFTVKWRHQGYSYEAKPNIELNRYSI